MALGFLLWTLFLMAHCLEGYLRSWHEHVTVHYALNVQLELSSHFSQMICVLVTNIRIHLFLGICCLFVFISKAIFHSGTKSCLYFLLSDSHICLSIYSTASITVWEHFTDGLM